MESQFQVRAREWVENARNFYESAGRKLALAEYSDPCGMFVKGDLYIFVLDTNGIMLAHGINKRFVGENFMEVKDSEGKYFIREIVESAMMDGRGIVEYKWFNPETKEWSPKTTYFEIVDDLIICAADYEVDRAGNSRNVEICGTEVKPRFS